jgi:predicted RNase H-like HicB family nuclease
MGRDYHEISMADKVQRIRIPGVFTWLLERDEKADMWIATCDALGLVVEGKTYGELNQAIDEGLQLVFRSLVRHGDLERYLEERGWKVAGDLPPIDLKKPLKFDIFYFANCRAG